MNPQERQFHPLQAQEIAKAFADESVRYLEVIELHLLESFRIEFEKQHPSQRPLRSSTEITSSSGKAK